MNTPSTAEKFSCPEFLAMERTIIDDFVDCTRECCAEVEVCVRALNSQGGPEYIHRMFRSMHSLKGNCQMVGLAPLNALMHRIEEVFSKVRAHPEQYLPELGEFLLLATDEIEGDGLTSTRSAIRRSIWVTDVGSMIRILKRSP